MFLPAGEGRIVDELVAVVAHDAEHDLGVDLVFRAAEADEVDLLGRPSGSVGLGLTDDGQAHGHGRTCSQKTSPAK